MKKLKKLVPIILILALAAFLRLYNLDSVPPSLNQDEAVNGYDAYSILKTGKDHHGNRPGVFLESYGDWTSPLITYITIPFVAAFDLSLFSIRLPIAILAILTVLLIYLATLEITRKPMIATCAALMLAISPWHITGSRWAVPSNTLPFLLSLSLYLLVRGLRSHLKQATLANVAYEWKDKIFLVASGLLFGITGYAYPTMKLFIPILVAGIFFILIWPQIKQIAGETSTPKRARGKQSRLRSIWVIFMKSKMVIIFAFLAALVISPIFILTFLDPDKYQSRFSQVSIFVQDQNPVFLFIKNYLSYFSPVFLFTSGDPDKMHIVSGFGHYYWVESITLLVGLLIVLQPLFKKRVRFLAEVKMNRTVSKIVLWWLIVFPIGAALTESHHALRVMHAIPLFAVLSGIGLGTIVETLYSKMRHSNYYLIPGLVLTLILSAQFTLLVKTYFTKYPYEIQRSFQYGLEDVFEYVKKNESKYDEVIISRRINTPYIYLLFYNKIEPEFVQRNLEVDRYSYTFYDAKSLGKYKFQEVEEEDVEDAEKLREVKYIESGEVAYLIYEKGGKLIVCKP